MPTSGRAASGVHLWPLTRALPLAGRLVALPIASRLLLSILAIVALVSALLMILAVRSVEDRIVAEAQGNVVGDLNAAHEFYSGKLDEIRNIVRLTTHRFFLIDALVAGRYSSAEDELREVRLREDLDVLTVTDERGRVLFRAANPPAHGDDQSGDELVRAVLTHRRPAAATQIVSAEDLRRESPVLSLQARFRFVDTPKARPRDDTEQTSGMMLKAAAPILGSDGDLIGVLYGGNLLNRNFEIVDKTTETVFRGLTYGGRRTGTATIFQDDVRIATTVKNEDGSRAIGTRVSEEVYNRVVLSGEPWIGRAYVVNDWYISAYEPIRDFGGNIVGMLYVGILAEEYDDIRRRTTGGILGVAGLGALLAAMLSYAISRGITRSLGKLVSASRELANGNLDVRVGLDTNDEFQQLGETFDGMAAALQQRDLQLKEMASQRVRKSERLAMVGQLAAGVAHELNNPLQGIIAYSYLLLEELPDDHSARESINTIVVQATRCTDIVRGLLDFSRRKKPVKKPSDVQAVLDDTLRLVEKQAVFHNIEVVREYGDAIPLVTLDPSQIQQVFMNLVMNAAEAMDGSGQLTIATRYHPQDDTVEVRFGDTGHGISPEHMEKLFAPFFTTKETGHGTGLGLAISYGIVREHKGNITVDSEVDKGTTFAVELPVTAEEEPVDYDGPA